MRLDQFPDHRQSARSRSHHRRRNVETPQCSSSCSSATSAGRRGHRRDPHNKDQGHYKCAHPSTSARCHGCNLPVLLLTASQARPTEPGCRRPPGGRDKRSCVTSFDVTLAQRGHVVLSSATGRLERHTVGPTCLRTFSARRAGGFRRQKGWCSSSTERTG
jgi:hypothetical protein